MKKIALLIGLSISILSCSKVGKGEFIISGEAKGVPNGNLVILKNQSPDGITMSVDSAKVNNGKFELKGKAGEPKIYALFLKGIKQPVPFILESGEIEVTIDKDSIWKSNIGGTFNNNEFQKFNTETTTIQKKLVDYQNNNFKKLITAKQKQDQAALDKLNQGFNVIQEELNNYVDNYPEKNPKSFLSVLMIESLFQSQKFELNKVKKLYNNLDESLKATQPGKNIALKLKTIEGIKKPTASTAAVVGQIAPDFSAKDLDGNVVTLRNTIGKITIIDFWASWCGPCRRENPNVVALYNELHGKGLNIIGVSLDSNMKDWKNAVVKDKITWTQVSNLKEWKEPIAKLYGVEEIPTTFILDSTGKIIAKNLRGDALKAKIKELLGVK